MSKHTPGPWVFGILSWGEGAKEGVEEKPFDYSGPGYYENPSIMDKNGNEIVGCGEYDVFSSPENTRLMVAAPDLLKALEEMVDNEEQVEFESWLSDFSPSGDVDSVTAQWLASSRFDDFCAAVEPQLKAIAKAKGE